MRKIIVLLLLVSWILMPISALMIHHTFGHLWLHIHVITGVIFVICCIWHLILNRKALKRYFRNK